MRRILCILLLLLCGLTPAQKKVLLQGSQDYEQLIRQHSPTLWLDGTRSEIEPLRHFTMDDNAASTAVVDASANGNGTASANTADFDAAAGSCKVGTCLLFAVASRHLIDTGSDVIGTGEDSVCMWTNPTTMATAQIQMLAYNAKLVFWIDKATGKLRLSSNNSTVLTSTSVIGAGAFTHICFTRTAAGAATFYINGVADSSSGATGAPEAGAMNLFIGNRDDGERTFGGYLDDIRIYDRALTPGEISLIYNNGVGHQSQSVGKNTGNVVVDASTATVSDWGDKSGNGRYFSQPTAANQPLFVSQAINGRSAVRFDGAASTMTSTATLGNLFGAGAKTAFIVTSPSLLTSAITWILGDSAECTIFMQTNAAKYYTRNYDTNSDAITWGSAYLTGRPYLHEIVHDGVNLTFNQNNSGVLSAASGNTGATTGTMKMGFQTGYGYFNGSIAELITFNKVLPSDVRIRIQKGLCKKWGASC